MIARYSKPELTKLWSDQTKFDIWLKIEIAVCEVLTKQGKMPQKDLDLIKKNAKFNIERIHELEKVLRHDVISFTRTVSESLGEEKKWVHYGLTSTDVVDTAQGYRLKLVNNVIKSDLEKIKIALKEKALTYKKLVTIGRTHGIHAEITTIGLKFALWYSDLKRISKVFYDACDNIEIGKISGAVGTFANTTPEIQDEVCKKLGINSAAISTQVLQRDRHAQYISAITLIGTLLEKITLEVRHLQRTEVQEFQEGFGPNQKGSSAMPHKRNPISSENINGLVRVLRGYLIPSFENVALWHERDISHSSAERIVLQDATTLIDYMLKRTTNIIDRLIVNEKNVAKNVAKTKGLIYTQQVMTAIINKGNSREFSYDIVQKIASHCFDNNSDFFAAVNNSEAINKILTKVEITKLFDVNFHLKWVDTIYKRTGL